MPKILIKEQDLSTAGLTTSSNFNVAVLGQVNTNTCTSEKLAAYKTLYGKSLFDENGIAELSDVKIFEDYIGCKEDAATTAGIAPTLTKLGEDTVPFSGTIDQLIEEGPEYVVTYAECLYTSTTETASYDGYLHKGTAKYTKISVKDASTSDPKPTICIIESANVGTDAVTSVDVGNKIAHELLSLGYKIYFKKIASDSYSSLDLTALQDRSIYDFRYIIHGLLKDNSLVNSKIAAVATKRGDCIALLEIDETAYAGKSQAEAISAIIARTSTGDRHSAYFAPYVEYAGTFTSPYTNKFPACFHYLACAIKSLQTYNEWFAIAGYTRGVSNYVIKNLGCRFGDAATSALQPRKSGKASKAVNLIVSLPAGYLLWGNRTAESLDATDLTFKHFLNIRQLCCTLNKKVYDVCRQLTYNPNSDVLWMNFCGAISPLLETMKANQGISDYAFVKKSTDMKGKLFAAIRIVPIEAVEDFEIGLTLEDNLDSPDVVISESLTPYQE